MNEELLESICRSCLRIADAHERVAGHFEKRDQEQPGGNRLAVDDFHLAQLHELFPDVDLDHVIPMQLLLNKYRELKSQPSKELRELLSEYEKCYDGARRAEKKGDPWSAQDAWARVVDELRELIEGP